MLHSQVHPLDNHPFYTWRHSVPPQDPEIAVHLGELLPTDIGKVYWDEVSGVYWVLVELANPVTGVPLEAKWVAISSSDAPATSDLGTPVTPNSVVKRDASGNFHANRIDAELNGNAATATTLQTSRVISLSGDVVGAATFDGSANIDISTTVQLDSIALGTDTTGNYVASANTAGYGLSGAVDAESGVFTVVSNATDLNTPSTIVFRDSTGGFSAGTITAGQITGPVVGNSSTATTLQTARTITVSGDVTGSASFDGSSDIDIVATIQPNSVALGADTTGNYVAELTAGTGVTIIDSGTEGAIPTISIGQPIGTSDSPTFVDLTVSGDLTVNGTTTTIDSVNLAVKDSLVQLATGNVSAAVPYIGLQAVRGGPDSFWMWDESIDAWRPATSFDGVSFTTGDIAARVITADTFNGPMVGTLTGNASTASAWLTARTITVTGDGSGSVTFNGSSDATLNLTITPNAVELGVNTTGSYVASATTAGAGISGSVNAESGVLTITSNATSSTVPSTLVLRDPLGNFYANMITADVTGAASLNVLKTGDTMSGPLTVNGTVTADALNGPLTGTVIGSLIGNASTASALAAPQTINGVSFNGTGPITIAAAAGTLTGNTLAPNVLSSSLTSVGTLAALTVTAPITGSVTGSSGSTTGNAATATTLQTARNINGVSFNGSTDITIPTVVVSNDVTTNALHYINFTSGISGNQSLRVANTKLTFNPSTGDLAAAGNLTAYSDARLKTDLEPIRNALEKVSELTGYNFTRTDSGVRQTGLIAQDVLKVSPEAVNQDGEYMSVAYGNLVGLLVEAIKELKAEIEELKRVK